MGAVAKPSGLSDNLRVLASWLTHGWLLLALLGLHFPGQLRAEPGVQGRGEEGAKRAAEGNTSVYRYTDDQGRTHFVGSLNQVPSRFRTANNTVDLSHINTHSDIGDGLHAEALSTLERVALSERLDAVRGDLVGLPLCADLRAKASSPTARVVRLWQDHPHLVVLGALALCLLLLSRRMAEWLPAGQWSRLLAFMLPALVLVAAFATGVRQAASIARDLRADAEPCDPGLDLADGASSDGVTQRQDLVSRLRTAAHRRDQATADVVEATIRQHYRTR